MTEGLPRGEAEAKGRKPFVDRLVRSERAIVLAPNVRSTGGADKAALARDPGQRLQEAVGLALAIDLDIVHEEVINLSTTRPATLFGTGKVDEIAGLVKTLEAGIVIVDRALTPVQQRNLEKAWNTKVLDRTGLILEIFGRRARTKEGALQVELAHLNYQRGRLVRSWTHLERQRGGAGFMGGPGETQIEADRRLIQERILRLERDLEQVRRTRQLHRVKRQKAPWPVVALVGYTNAGKSTLFNRLTGAEVLAEDMLFATLDPTLRRIRLPSGLVVILSDTVGFISDLPTHLIAAFRATLEEVIEADLVLHVRDISNPDSANQASDVEQILFDLGVDTQKRSNIIEVLNKIDALPDDGQWRLNDTGAAFPVSALTGAGIDTLLAEIDRRLAGETMERDITLGADEMPLLDWLHRNATVLAQNHKDDGSVRLTVVMTALASANFETQRTRRSPR